MSGSPDYILRRVLEEMNKDLEDLWSESGAEALDGLYSMYEGSEDLTCLSSKRVRGRRDKRYGRGNVFRGGDA